MTNPTPSNTGNTPYGDDPHHPEADLILLAGDWEREATRLDALAGTKTDPHDAAEVSARAQAFAECVRKLREAIQSRQHPSPDEEQ